ncbi:Hsp70 protein [Oryzisolibacter propanilivorax]|uniref:Hsp70 protein n=1 Tax=Oryzisolibacter propanilivorax TaxID=1527607 RepID=A0A1G9S8Y7_9BURK|nr:Hsp70 family protein [Oryzisolibacter propanilivorax]SDM31924.1 Hsp70 protein [Oryzisolibacter propanilivorax]
MATTARYAVGIDLGTSHTALAYAELTGSAQDIRLLPLPQRVSPAEVQADALLPSARYQGAPGELGDAWRTPWPPRGASDAAPAVIGRWARELGAATPQRLVASAKSWLSHPGVDRTAPILPWGAGEDVAKISPLEASAGTLAHVRAAWDAAHPDAPLADQVVALTVPASFDEGARALTLQAAGLAGLPASLQLLEEPKAAFHDWLVLQGEQLADRLAGSRLVLVVDVGGGTTDLTLVRIEPSQDGGLPVLTRTAVGEHLMLGGDNMDLALAHRLEPHFAGGEGQRLAPARFAELVQRCRAAKERLLANNAPAALPITLLGTGSKLLAQTRSVQLAQGDVRQWVVEGFLPPAALHDVPTRRQGALRGLGLPYPQDAAISRHLVQFLALHAAQEGGGADADAVGRPAGGAANGAVNGAADGSANAATDRRTDAGAGATLNRLHGALPDTLLLNGGVFHAHALAERLAQLLTGWRGAPVQVLHNPHPDWAVARGAAAHALTQYQSNRPDVLAEQGSNAIKQIVPRIGGGSARSYWLVLPGKSGTSGAPQALCLLPRGTEEGTRLVLSGRRFALRLGQPVRFALVARSQGQAQAGQIVPLAGEGWVELPPASTVLPAPQGRASARIEVQLQTTMTEVGTLEVRCVSVDDPAQSWRLPFTVRGVVQDAADSSKTIASGADGTSAGAENDPDSATARLLEAEGLLERIFGTQAQEVAPRDVRQLRQSLQKLLGPREQWSLPLLRALADALLARARRRRRTPEHERAWLNLTGWCLRPGVGAELDGWRVGQLWQLWPQGLAHPQDPANWTEWWVLWRRVAAGLHEAQQMEVLEQVAGCMQRTVERSARARWGSYDDMLRLFAAMEAVPWEYRREMGQWMLQRLKRPDEPQHTWWAIGRLAARTALAANAHRVMPPAAAQEFLDATLAQDWRKNEHAMFAAVQIARRTGERTLDVPDAMRTQVLNRLQASGAPARWQEQVREVVQLEAEDRQRSLGDSLPPGLVLL